MNCATNFAYANEEACFAIIEDVCGTLKKPTVNDRIFSVGPVDFGQEQEFLPDEQIRQTASELSRIKGRKLAGEWSFGSYVKPSGTPGTVPEHNVLFQGLLGAGQVQGSTYEYTLENQVDSFSLWVKKGHTVFAFRGAAVESAEFNIAGEEVAGINWGGKFFEQSIAGTGKASGTFTGGESIIQLKSTHALRYSKGMYVTFGADTNTGAGYLITGVNQSNDKIAITPALQSAPSQAGLDPVVAPWWPAVAGEVGEPGHGKMGSVTVNNAEAVILSARVTLTNNLKYYENEKNNKWTAERFGRPGKRSVEGEIELNYITEGPSYFYRAAYQIQNALVIPVGNVSGYIMELQIPYAEYGTPKISGEEEFAQNIPFVGVASAALNDEMKVVFK